VARNVRNSLKNKVGIFEKNVVDFFLEKVKESIKISI
jgi:hypothetical protein